MDETNPQSDWASRRKSIYLVAMVLLLSSVSFVIFWQFWYSAPSCFDHLKNGDETGVDCGGSCSLICSESALKPIVRWDPRLFEISPGLWSILIYVENPNVSAMATYLPYTFTIYDQNNNVLLTKNGATILPKNQTVGIFEGGMAIKGMPKRAIFDLGDKIVWQKSIAPDPNLAVIHSPLLRLDSMPRIEANVKNKEIYDIKNIELVAAIFDGNDNAIAASRTFVEKLKGGEDTNIFFTWPKPFDLGSKACENPSNVMLLLDRSGSMASLGANPQRPLTDAKEAAISFINRLTNKDKVGAISFATKSKNPIDLNLTNDFASAQKSVEAVKIEGGSTQYTNIYEALHSAWQELVSLRVLTGTSKIIILLTDGVANNPPNPNGGAEAEDIKYAENMALQESVNLKKDDIILYTVGLGQKINESFLKQISSGDDHYFFAPSPDNLETIYKNISSAICKEIPARIEITYKIFGDAI